MKNIKGSEQNTQDTYNYKGWLTSDSFMKRAFAVFGYSMIGGIVFYLALIPIAIVLSILQAIFS